MHVGCFQFLNVKLEKSEARRQLIRVDVEYFRPIVSSVICRPIQITIANRPNGQIEKNAR